MKLKSIDITNFRSIRETQTIDFPDSGLVLIRGINTDSGDSSGSGKSSLVLAIQWALGCCPYPTNTLQHWGSLTPPKVRAVFSSGDKTIIVQRAPLKIWVDDVAIHGTAKQLEEKIQALFGMSPELLEMVTYRQQGKGPLFANMTDSARKEFLAEVLELSKYEALAVEAAKKATQLQVDIKMDEVRLEATQAADTRPLPPQVVSVSLAEADTWDHMAGQLTASIAGLKVQDRAVHQRVAAEAEAALRIIREEFQEPGESAEVGVLEEKLLKCDAHMARTVAADDVLKTKYFNDLKEIDAQINKARLATAKISELKSATANLMKEAAALQSDNCPKCLRQWDQAKAQVAEIETQISTNRGWMAELETGPKVEDLQVLRSQITFTPNPLIEKIRVAKVGFQKGLQDLRLAAGAARSVALREREAKELKVREAARNAVATETADLGKQIWALNEKVTDMKAKANEIRAIDEMNHQRTAAFARAIEVWEAGQGKAAELRQNITKLKAALAIEQDVAAAMGRTGFLSSIFEEVLVEIQNKANEILANIANVSHLVLRIDSTKEKASGGTTNKIDIKVLNKGQEIPYDAGLSGGMAASVGLAIDISIGEVVMSRKGSFPGWLVLDESVDGLGAVSKESCMEMLARYASDRMILVIDHASECQGLFNQVIDLKMVDGVTTVV